MLPLKSDINRFCACTSALKDRIPANVTRSSNSGLAPRDARYRSTTKKLDPASGTSFDRNDQCGQSFGTVQFFVGVQRELHPVMKPKTTFHRVTDVVLDYQRLTGSVFCIYTSL